MHDNHSGYRISVVDEDPLRARKDARELLAATRRGGLHGQAGPARTGQPGGGR